MGKVRIRDAVRVEERGGKPLLIIDFTYIDGQRRPQRYRRHASVQTMTAAKAEAKRLLFQAATMGTLETRHRGMKFTDFVDSVYRPVFLPLRKPGTRQRYEGILKQGVLAHFGAMPLDEIDAMEFRRYAVVLKQRGVTASVRHHQSFVRGVLRAAVEAGELDAMPALPALPPMPKKLPDAPTLEEVEALLAVTQGWVLVAVALAVFAGLRSGEVRALERRDIDLEAGVITVRRAYSEDELVDQPQDGEERVIPIAARLREILAVAVRGKLPSARIVVNEQGATPRRQAIYYAVTSTIKRHGLPHRSFHANRHGFVSELVRRGASVEAVRELAGHAKLATTQRYVHATGRDLRRTIELLNGSTVDPAAGRSV